MPPPAGVAQATEQYDIGSAGPSRKDPDAGLVAAAKCGDAISIETLIQRRQGSVLRLAEGITRNYADAQDVAQNAFLLAFRRLNSFQGESLFSTWLARIAVNQSLATLRKRRPGIIPLELTTEATRSQESAEIGDRSMSPEEQVSQQEMQDVVAAAIKGLKPSFRTAIEVHYLQENSTEETARILQLSGEALKSRLHRARRKLREALRQYMPPELASAA